MENENMQPPSVSEMIRVTGANTAAFMDEIAKHIDKLEATVVELQERIAESEKANGQQPTDE